MSFRTERIAARRDAGCTGKERYGSFARARAVASRSAHNKGSKLGAYRCKFCGSIHIGNNLREGGVASEHVDPRQRYIVFGIAPDGRDLLVGYSKEPDGGQVARRLVETAGWRVSRIVDRKPQQKDAA